VKHKKCSFEGCTNFVQKGGVCFTHGAKVKRCNHEGCTNIVVKGGVCVTHGAKKKQSALRDGTTKLLREEFVSRMVLRWRRNNVASREYQPSSKGWSLYHAWRNEETM
jgi:hypothetical protein